MTSWEIEATELVNCNCSYGCPCQFNAPPTTGFCEAAAAFAISRGRYGDVSLDGTRAVMIVRWPGPIHEGNGEMQVIVDEAADADQRAALLAIMTGEDTEPMATMWSVFSAMCPTRYEPLARPIDIEIDVDGRTGRVHVPDVLEMTAEPIRNPVTGAPHRVRIDLPAGFEYEIAEIGSATTRAKGSIELALDNSYGQLARIHLSNTGVVRSRAVA